MSINQSRDAAAHVRNVCLFLEETKIAGVIHSDTEVLRRQLTALFSGPPIPNKLELFLADPYGGKFTILHQALSVAQAMLDIGMVGNNESLEKQAKQAIGAFEELLDDLYPMERYLPNNLEDAVRQIRRERSIDA